MSDYRPLQDKAGLWALDNPTVSQRLQRYAALVEDQLLRHVWEAAGGEPGAFTGKVGDVLALVRALRK